MKWLIYGIISLVQLVIFYYLLSAICDHWHLPFWGIFWVFLLYSVSEGVSKRVGEAVK